MFGSVGAVDEPPSRKSEPPRASLRPSRPPHAATPARGAVRIAFALGWVALQGALVLTADRRPDGAFGFRMFNESSTIHVHLLREVEQGGARVEVPVEGGAWNAPDAAGTPRRFHWTDRVKRPELGVFDREIHASYGVGAQLARLEAALADVAAHIPEDSETRRLLLDVTVRRNGREPRVVRLVSPERARAERRP